MTPGRTVAYTAGALGAALVVGLLVSPDPARLEPPAPVAQPVVSTTFVCPEFRAVQGVSSTTIVAAVPTGVTEGTPAPGRAVLAPLTLEGVPKPLGTITVPGGATVVAAPPGSRGPVVGLGIGGLAPGLSAGQLTVVRSGTGRGLAGIDCADVAAEQWFVGGASTTGQRASLILVNAEVTAATVDIELLDATGPISAPGGQGVVVPARSTKVVALDALAPGRAVLATHVTADVGRLAIALRTTSRVGSIPRGIDYVPPAAAPSTRLVIPALPTGPGSRQLFVAAPGNDDVDVRLTVVGRSGSFPPAGADSFVVSAGALKRLDLSRILQSEDSALLIEAEAPVVAGVRVQLTQSAGSRRVDYAWSSAVPPLTADGIDASTKVGEGFVAWLMLSAPDGPAQVAVATGAPGRSPTRQTVKLAAGTTTVLPLKAVRGGTNVVTVVRPLPGSAPVWAGRVQQYKAADGTMLTIAPLRDARITVEVPQAVPDLSAAVPGG